MIRKTIKVIGLIFGFFLFFASIGGILNSEYVFASILLIISLIIIYYSSPKTIQKAIKNNGNYKYDDLKDFEKSLETTIKNKEVKSFKLDAESMNLEKWQYLKKKYPMLQMPYNNELHEDYQKNLNMFKSHENDIKNGKTLSLYEFEEEIVRQFSKEFLPTYEIKNVAPILISTKIAGFRYHDFKKKEVKLMLEMDSFQELKLVREEENEFDFYAVKLMWQNYHLGYVPRDYSKQVAEAIDIGDDVDCWLIDYSNTGNIDERTSIHINIKVNN